eukprot:gene74-222_t
MIIPLSKDLYDDLFWTLAGLSADSRRGLKIQQTAAMPESAATVDPNIDARWSSIKWTVYRGKAYDITDFIPRHPGGEWLVNLAIGRDCTALFESYHLRQELAVQAFNKMPVLEDFPVAAVPRAPYPGDSELYCDIRQRVRKEVFEGREHRGWHRQGSELAAAAVLCFAVACYTIY